MVNYALSHSYSGFRLAGSSAWLAKKDWREFCDYEKRSMTTDSNLLLAEEFDLWWGSQKLPQAGLGQSSITLSKRFFEQLVETPVPLAREH
jgi:hypothetical protein